MNYATAKQINDMIERLTRQRDEVLKQRDLARAQVNRAVEALYDIERLIGDEAILSVQGCIEQALVDIKAMKKDNDDA